MARRKSKPEGRTPSERILRRAQTTGESTPLTSDDIVPDAVAKRESSDRRFDEGAAEGGHLGTGIGDDRP